MNAKDIPLHYPLGVKPFFKTYDSLPDTVTCSQCILLCIFLLLNYFYLRQEGHDRMESLYIPGHYAVFILKVDCIFLRYSHVCNSTYNLVM